MADMHQGFRERPTLVFQRWAKPRMLRIGEEVILSTRGTFQSALEGLGTIKEVQIRGVQGYFLRRYSAARATAAQALRRSAFFAELPKHLMEVLFLLGIGVMTAVVFTQDSTERALSVIAVFATAGFRLLPSIVRAIASLNNVRVGQFSLDRVLEDMRAAENTRHSADEVVRPLAEVKDEIRKALAVSEASRVLLDVHDSYEDARAGGASLAEAAQKLNLKVVTIEAIDRTAQRPDGTIVNDIPQSADVLAAAFDSEVNVENDAINIGSNGFVFFEVEGITPARERPLDEIRDRVVADWKADETRTRLAAKAADVEKRVKDGASLDTVAAEMNLEKQTKRGLKRQADDADFGQQGVSAVFAIAQGQTGLTLAPTDDAQIVFKVTEVFEPAGADGSALADQAKASFSSGLADDLLDQLVSRLQAEYDVRIDQGAVERAMAF